MSHIIKTGPKQVRVDSALQFLWQKAAPNLTRGELASFADCGEALSHELACLADSVEAVGSLAAADQDTNGTRSGAMEDPSRFLFLMANRISDLSMLAFINSDAVGRLLEMRGEA